MDGEDYGIQMSNTEVAEFLTEQGHGVLSFGGETPYGLPLSFGYDLMNNRCIFQLVSKPNSQKQRHLSDVKTVNLVSYDWQNVDDWRSVIISGELVKIEEESPEAVAAAETFADHGAVVGLSVFNKPLDELATEWYELQIEEMTGYKSPMKAVVTNPGQ